MEAAPGEWRPGSGSAQHGLHRRDLPQRHRGLPELWGVLGQQAVTRADQRSQRQPGEIQRHRSVVTSSEHRDIIHAMNTSSDSREVTLNCSDIWNLVTIHNLLTLFLSRVSDLETHQPRVTLATLESLSDI